MSTRQLHETDHELTDSLGRYVLAIYEVAMENRVARSKEIAEVLGVSRPSVTGALQKLAKAGYIEYEPYGYVLLTAKGEREARQLLLKHRAAFDFFTTVLGLSPQRSEEVAAAIEQSLPADVLCRLVQFNSHYRTHSAAQFSWTPVCRNLCATLYGVESTQTCSVEETAQFTPQR